LLVLVDVVFDVVFDVEAEDPVDVVLEDDVAPLELVVSGMVGELELPPPPPPQEAKTTKNNVRMINFILDKTSCLLSGWCLYGEF
jgi:hypothetical protein